MAPEVNEEKGTYASHFYSWFFRKFIRVVFYFSWIFLVTWHSFAQLSACRYLLWLPLTWWWWWIVFVIWFYRRKLFSLISTRDHFQRSLPKQISNTPRAGFEPVLNLNSVWKKMSSGDNHYTTALRGKLKLPFIIWTLALLSLLCSVRRSLHSQRKYISATCPGDESVFLEVEIWVVSSSSSSSSCCCCNKERRKQHESWMP